MTMRFLKSPYPMPVCESCGSPNVERMEEERAHNCGELQMKRRQKKLLFMFLALTVATLIAFFYVNRFGRHETFILEEVVGAPEDTWEMLFYEGASGQDALFVATYHGDVYKFDGGNWQLVLETGRDRYCFIHHDSYGNLYVSTWGKLFRSSDNGKTWSTVFLFSPLQIWHMADLGNGTLIADNWVEQGPYLWRSNNFGETWFLWKNFTEMFPQYAEPSADPKFTGCLLIRHLHLVAFDQYTGKILVTSGDDIKHLFITSDGETWEEVEHGGHTSIMIFEDRILYGPDHKHGLTIYDKNTGTYDIVYERFGQRVMRIDDFVYDNKINTIYAGVVALPDDDYGIIYSSDKGETWKTAYRGKASPDRPFSEPVFVFLSMFRGELYVSMGHKPEGKLYRLVRIP